MPDARVLPAAPVRARASAWRFDRAQAGGVKEAAFMKILVTSQGAAVTDLVDPRFGRAAHFIVVDTETQQVAAHDNTPNLNAAQGAGIQAAEAVARLGVEAVVTGNVGPKAFRVLNAAGIRVFLCDAVPVEEAVRRFEAGKLTEAAGANVQGHWA
jgi:predicted Fe-Mo cluster-binding NifX family protein